MPVQFGSPLLDELRTYCYEYQIEEIPALLAYTGTCSDRQCDEI